MEILDSKSYCALCNKPLELNNIGAIVKDHTAQNACQVPCVVDYYKPENWPPHELKKANFVNKIEELQRRIQQPVMIAPPELQAVIPATPEAFTEFKITKVGDITTIESDSVGITLPFELFYAIMLRDLNITKFAILKLEVQNLAMSPICITMKQDDSNNKVLAKLLCNSYSALDFEFNHPYFINNNDLIIEFALAGSTVYTDIALGLKSKLTIQVLERSL